MHRRRYHLPNAPTSAGYRFAAELLLAGIAGWLLADYAATPGLDHFMAPAYAQFDWYEPFLDVMSLINEFICVGTALAMTVQFRQPPSQHPEPGALMVRHKKPHRRSKRKDDQPDHEG